MIFPNFCSDETRIQHARTNTRYGKIVFVSADDR